jgi:hypothetical protein
MTPLKPPPQKAKSEAARVGSNAPVCFAVRSNSELLAFGTLRIIISCKEVAA